MTRRLRWTALTAASGLALMAGCGQAFPCGELADSGPALAEVCADGVLTCEEDCGRNRYNVCPDVMPSPGLDQNGVEWVADLFFGRPNPYHPGSQCWRGSTPELGLSSYQCCYQAGALMPDSSFDFVNPFLSPESMLQHFLMDILPYGICACE